jgi:hypothetical protein
VTKGKYYIDKRCTNMGGLKNVKKHNEKKVLYSISKDQIQKLGSPKNEKVEKT